MSAPADSGQDGVFGRLPVLLDEREYGTLGAHSTCFAYAVATWCFLTGGYVAELVGAVHIGDKKYYHQPCRAAFVQYTLLVHTHTQEVYTLTV